MIHNNRRQTNEEIEHANEMLWALIAVCCMTVPVICLVGFVFLIGIGR